MRIIYQIIKIYVVPATYNTISQIYVDLENIVITVLTQGYRLVQQDR